jgi:hypothetical protein
MGAYIDASDVSFPAECIRCSGAPATTHNLSARRGIDLIFVAHWEFLDIPAPVCARCKRRRRIAGIAQTTGVLVFIFGGGLAAMTLVMNEWKAAAAILGAAILIVALVGRIRGDVVLDWFSLGARVDYLRGEGAPLRFQFRRPEYARVWLEANPRAVRTRDLLRKPTMTATEPSAAPVFGRKTPALTLLVSLALLALHHWYAVTQREVYSVLVLLLATVAGLAAGGTVYPPIFYSLGKYGKHLRVGIKVLGGLSAAAGFAIGFILMIKLY